MGNGGVRTVRPAGRLTGGLLGLAGVAILVGYACHVRDVGQTAVIFCGLVAVFGIVAAFPGRRYIRIEEEGVVFARYWKPTRIAWTDIEAIFLVSKPVRESAIHTARLHRRGGETVDLPLNALDTRADRIVKALIDAHKGKVAR